MNIISSDNSDNSEVFAELVIAHGAGAGCHSEFITSISEQLNLRGVRTHRFNFSYMARIEAEGKRRPPPKLTVLQQEYQEVIDTLSLQTSLPLWIGGKSMGGRVASTLVEQGKVSGVVCLGYPFHPPGKPDKLRTEHLKSMDSCCLIVQGERDTFGNAAEISQYPLSERIEVHLLADGDHSLKPRKSSGLTQQQHITTAAEVIAQYIRSRSVK